MATRQRELALLVVGRDGARLAGLRLEYTGETTCAASADDLSALLDRRPADAVIFLSHTHLAAPVLDYLKRRGKPLPGSIISLGNGVGESDPKVAAALRRVADADDPRELLARLFEALAASDIVPVSPALPEIAEEPPEPLDDETQEPQELLSPEECPEPDEPPAAMPTARQEARARRLHVVLERRLSQSPEP